MGAVGHFYTGFYTCLYTMEPLLQRSEAWFSARLGKINASELDKVLGFGFGRDEARRKLFETLRNHTRPPPFSNDATKWGQEHEAGALATYVEHSSFAQGFTPREHGGQTHPVHEWLRASPDALLYDDENRLVGLVEIKCPYRLRNSAPPPHDAPLLTGYILQMNLQMEVYDVSFCDFVQWTPQGISVRRVRRNRELFQYVLSMYEDFYDAAVKSSEDYKRLDYVDVMHIEQRVVGLHHAIDSSQFETIATTPSDNSRSLAEQTCAQRFDAAMP